VPTSERVPSILPGWDGHATLDAVLTRRRGEEIRVRKDLNAVLAALRGRVGPSYNHRDVRVSP